MRTVTVPELVCHLESCTLSSRIQKTKEHSNCTLATCLLISNISNRGFRSNPFKKKLFHLVQ